MVEILEFFQPKGLPFLEKKPVSNSCKNNIDLKFHSPRKKGSLVMTVLMGPRWSGKTSLLFSYALSKACEGEDIYFICFKNKEKLIESPPFLPEWFVVLPDLNLKKELLKLIHFRFFKNCYELQKFCATLHNNEEDIGHLPCHFIVDDFHFYIDASLSTSKEPESQRELRLIFSKTISLLVEAVFFTGKQRESPISLLLAEDLDGLLAKDNPSKFLSKKYLYEFWNPEFYRLDVVNNSTDFGLNIQLSLIIKDENESTTFLNFNLIFNRGRSLIYSKIARRKHNYYYDSNHFLSYKHNYNFYKVILMAAD